MSTTSPVPVQVSRATAIPPMPNRRAAARTRNVSFFIILSVLPENVRILTREPWKPGERQVGESGGGGPAPELDHQSGVVGDLGTGGIAVRTGDLTEVPGLLAHHGPAAAQSARAQDVVDPF